MSANPSSGEKILAVSQVWCHWVVIGKIAGSVNAFLVEKRRTLTESLVNNARNHRYVPSFSSTKSKIGNVENENEKKIHLLIFLFPR